MELLDKFLNDKNSKNSQLIYDVLDNFADWIKTPYWIIRYMKDVEWSWMNGTTNIGEL